MYHKQNGECEPRIRFSRMQRFEHTGDDGDFGNERLVHGRPKLRTGNCDERARSREHRFGINNNQSEFDLEDVGRGGSPRVPARFGGWDEKTLDRKIYPSRLVQQRSLENIRERNGNSRPVNWIRNEMDDDQWQKQQQQRDRQNNEEFNVRVVAVAQKQPNPAQNGQANKNTEFARRPNSRNNFRPESHPNIGRIRHDQQPARNRERSNFETLEPQPRSEQRYSKAKSEKRDEHNKQFNGRLALRCNGNSDSHGIVRMDQRDEIEANGSPNSRQTMTNRFESMWRRNEMIDGHRRRRFDNYCDSKQNSFDRRRRSKSMCNQRRNGRSGSRDSRRSPMQRPMQRNGTDGRRSGSWNSGRNSISDGRRNRHHSRNKGHFVDRGRRSGTRNSGRSSSQERRNMRRSWSRDSLRRNSFGRRRSDSRDFRRCPSREARYFRGNRNECRDYRSRSRGYGRGREGRHWDDKQNGWNSNYGRRHRSGSRNSVIRGDWERNYRSRRRQSPCNSSERRNENSTIKRVTYIPEEEGSDEDVMFSKGVQRGANFGNYSRTEVRANNAKVNPIDSFDDAELTEEIIANVSRSNFVDPTPIQKYAIPVLMAGSDLVACAQTGSGKTAAFLLPILNYLSLHKVPASIGRPVRPLALIIVPTRELARQIVNTCLKLAFRTQIRTCLVSGGIAVGYQISKITDGCHILVATTGRLCDFIKREIISLEQCNFFVLDEADRMLDMGFQADIETIVEIGRLNESRTTMMFSATFPREIQELAGRYLKENYVFMSTGVVGGACSDVIQEFMLVGKGEKRDTLKRLLNDLGDTKSLIFVEKKQFADFLGTDLSQNGYHATTIHGDREQRERDIALKDFVRGKSKCLVATKVAARGLDIPGVDNVINYDLPSTLTEYVHRIGRTGRCGNVGRSISFYDSADPKCTNMSTGLIKILEKAKQKVPEFLVRDAETADSCLEFDENEFIGDARLEGKKKSERDNCKNGRYSMHERENDDQSENSYSECCDYQDKSES